MVRMPYRSDLDLDKKTTTLEDSSFRSVVQSMLVEIGEDPTREGLLKTPERFEKAIKELTSGYAMTSLDAVGEGIFEAEGQGLVAVKEIEFHSLCEHHVLPFWGHVSIGYYPDKKILGLSKLARVVEVFSRRLQVQERLTREIAQAISDLVGARAVFVKIEAQHMCMMMRGVRKNDSRTLSEFGIRINDVSAPERERLWKSVES